MVRAVVSEVVGCAERKKGNDWYDEECQIKVEGRNKAQNKMLNKEVKGKGLSQQAELAQGVLGVG